MWYQQWRLPSDHWATTYASYNVTKTAADRKIKKTSSFKHAAWSKDSILCFWRRHIVCNEHRTSRCHGNVTSLPLPLYRSRSCADVLRGERADVTDFSRFSWPWWMRSVVKHNMLKCIEHEICSLIFCTNLFRIISYSKQNWARFNENIHKSSCELNVFFVRFYWTFNFFKRFGLKFNKKNRLFVAELFRGNGQTLWRSQ